MTRRLHRGDFSTTPASVHMRSVADEEKQPFSTAAMSSLLKRFDENAKIAPLMEEEISQPVGKGEGRRISRGHLFLLPDITTPERPERYLAEDGSSFGPPLAPGVPDMRVTEDELRVLWFRDTTAVVDIEISPIDPDSLHELRFNVGTGIGDRGLVILKTPTLLRAMYKTISDTRQEHRMHLEYTQELLMYIGVGMAAVKGCTIMRHDETPEARARIMRRFGGPRHLR